MLKSNGTVKWFNPTKGFGFIGRDGGEKDVFVHISAVELAGFHTLHDGQKVRFDVQGSGDRKSAVNIEVI